MENNQTEICCTPEGQIKRYLNCVGCDRKPEKTIYIENKYITAVQWLIRQQKHNKFFDIETIEQALAMEKKQKITFANEYTDAVMGGCIKFAEEYYEEDYNNETYGK